MNNTLKRNIKELFVYICAGIAVWYCYVMIINAQNVKAAISQSIERCVGIIIPSLFALMAISEIIVSTGIYTVISKPFFLLSRYIMKIPDSLFFVFLLGNTAGYPVGAKLLEGLCERKIIRPKTAEIMMCSCYNAGPAFFTGAIGLAIYGSVRAGVVIYLSVLLSNFVTAIILGWIFRIKEDTLCSKLSFNSEIFTDSICAAGKSLMSICLLIMFFSTIISVADKYNVFARLCDDNDKLVVIVKSLLEITSVTELTTNSYRLLPVVAGLCSFGGICVIMQILVMSKKRFPLRLFLLTRVMSFALSALFCSLLTKLMLPDNLPAYHNEKVFVKINNFIPAICLTMMIFLLIIKKRLAFSKGICYNKEKHK